VTTELFPTTTSTADAGPKPRAPSTDRVRGLVCRNCRRAAPLGLAYVCDACFGPLEIDYDLDAISIDRSTIAARPPGIWRYLELLPVDAPHLTLRLSASQLKTISHCTYEHFVQKVLDPSSIAAPEYNALTKGSLIHDAIMHWATALDKSPGLAAGSFRSVQNRP